jgi:phosphoribosylaminoimidazole (AIR) synthetase
VRGLAHITGGGLTENLPRILPEGLGAEIDLDAWALPPVFGWLRAQGGIEDAEMLKTFNCGIGMVLVVAPDRAEALAALLREAGETVSHAIGRVEPGAGMRYRGPGVRLPSAGPARNRGDGAVYCRHRPGRPAPCIGGRSASRSLERRA